MDDAFTSVWAEPDALFETPWLLARVARLRSNWRLSRDEVSAMLGVSEETLVSGWREGGDVLERGVEARIRHLDEVDRYARGLLAGHDASSWLRAPAAALFGRTPLDVMSHEPGAIREVRNRLREEHALVFGVGA